MDRLIAWYPLALGFTGAFPLMYLLRSLYQGLFPPPTTIAHFSPKGGCTDVVVRELQRARHEILVLAYSFSSKPIAEALVSAKIRGVHVEVVLDRSNEQEAFSSLPVLVEGGVTPLIDSQHAIAHNKVMLVDGHTILTGSFNFTHQAEVENAENLLVIKGHRELFHRYRQNFAVHKGHSSAHGRGAASHAASRRAA
jgi:phosphatidylserine/phosphatidylglycerophosphate/cardiolipin synthase-like enzyme